MGCLRGSKFTCILSLSRGPGGPRVLFPSGPRSDLAAMLAVATPCCSPETARGHLACLRKTGFL